MRLRIAVNQQQRRAAAAAHDVDGRAARRDLLTLEAGKK